MSLACQVCFELLYSTHHFLPCGHIVCQTCTADRSESACPVLASCTGEPLLSSDVTVSDAIQQFTAEIEHLEATLVNYKLTFDDRCSTILKQHEQDLVDSIAANHLSTITFAAEALAPTIDDLFRSDHLDRLIDELPECDDKTYLRSDRQMVHINRVYGTINKYEVYFVGRRRTGSKTVHIARKYLGYGKYSVKLVERPNLLRLSLMTIYGMVDTTYTKASDPIQSAELSSIILELCWPEVEQLEPRYQASVDKAKSEYEQSVASVQERLKQLIVTVEKIEELVEHDCIDRARRRVPTTKRLGKFELSMLKNQGMLTVSRKYKSKDPYVNASLSHASNKLKAIVVPLLYTKNGYGFGLHIDGTAIHLAEFSGDPLLGSLESKLILLTDIRRFIDVYIYIDNKGVKYGADCYIANTESLAVYGHVEDESRLPVNNRSSINFMFRHEPSRADYFMSLYTHFTKVYAVRYH